MLKIKSFRPKLQQVAHAVNQPKPSTPVAQTQPQPAQFNQTWIERPQTSSTPSTEHYVNPPAMVTVPAAGHDVVRLVSLGGVGNVTRNMYVYEYKDDIVIVDCGVGFPESEMLGVDLVIPDITYLKDKKSKIRGIVISHGHDDHIGGLPYLWPELDVPIYTQKLTAGFIKSKFTEHNLPKDKIHALDIGDTVELGAFKISFYRVSHSVPDSTGIVMRTPVGILIHQSDFKVDWSPVNGQIPDVGRLGAVGNEGVLFMAIDCLRVDKPGYTITEATIEPTFAEIEAKTKGMLLVTTTSSNITRLQQAINVAAKAGRKVAMSGRSMESNFQVARDLGYLDVPNGIIITQEEVKRFPPEKVMIIIAGSQGQPGSGLSRVANFDHRFIRVNKDDSIVFSADPIPGSESNQNDLIDQLTKIGCRVYASAFESNLHVSGHASQEEIKMMIELAKPKYLLPIGGAYHHMRKFSEVAQSLGYKENQVLIPDQGEVLDIGQNLVRQDTRIDLSNVYVDGLGVGDIGNIVLRDRQVMSEEGIVMVVVPFNPQHQQVAGDPEIISRGFVFEKESGDLLDAGLDVVKSVLRDHSKADNQNWDWKYLRSQIEKNLEKFFYQETNRRPLILPVIVNL